MSHRQRLAFGATVLAVVVLGIGGVAPASANEQLRSDVQVGMAWADASPAPVVYGQAWQLEIQHGGYIQLGYPGAGINFTITGAPDGYVPTFYSYRGTDLMAPDYQFEGYLGPADAPSLPAGTHTVKAEIGYEFGQTHRGTSEPATLTITPAQLGVDFRIIDDPSNRELAIVTIALTGEFTTTYDIGLEAASYGPIGPRGQWKVVILDATGATVVERDVDYSASAGSFATTFPWSDAVAGETYSATATFTPDESTANNYSIAAAPTVSYTAPEPQRAPATLPKTDDEGDVLAAPVGFALPLWTLVMAGALTAIFIALTIVFVERILRTRSRPRPASDTEEVVA